MCFLDALTRADQLRLCFLRHYKNNNYFLFIFFAKIGPKLYSCFHINKGSISFDKPLSWEQWYNKITRQPFVKSTRNMLFFKRVEVSILHFRVQYNIPLTASELYRSNSLNAPLEFNVVLANKLLIKKNLLSFVLL